MKRSRWVGGAVLFCLVVVGLMAPSSDRSKSVNSFRREVSSPGSRARFPTGGEKSAFSSPAAETTKSLPSYLFSATGCYELPELLHSFLTRRLSKGGLFLGRFQGDIETDLTSAFSTVVHNEDVDETIRWWVRELFVVQEEGTLKSLERQSGYQLSQLEPVATMKGASGSLDCAVFCLNSLLYSSGRPCVGAMYNSELESCVAFGSDLIQARSTRDTPDGNWSRWLTLGLSPARFTAGRGSALLVVSPPLLSPSGCRSRAVLRSKRADALRMFRMLPLSNRERPQTIVARVLYGVEDPQTQCLLQCWALYKCYSVTVALENEVGLKRGSCYFSFTMQRESWEWSKINHGSLMAGSNGTLPSPPRISGAAEPSSVPPPSTVLYFRVGFPERHPPANSADTNSATPQSLVFGVLAGGKHVDSRLVVALETWLSRVRSVCFVEEENALFAKTAVQPFIDAGVQTKVVPLKILDDSWNGAWKNLPIARYLIQHYPPRHLYSSPSTPSVSVDDGRGTDWYVVVDDDSYIIQHNLYLFLQRQSWTPLRPFYGGWTFTTPAEPPRVGLTLVHGGGGIVFNAAAAMAISDQLGNGQCDRGCQEVAGDQRLACCFLNGSLPVPAEHFEEFSTISVFQTLSVDQRDRLSLYPISFHNMREVQWVRDLFVLEQGILERLYGASKVASKVPQPVDNAGRFRPVAPTFFSNSTFLPWPPLKTAIVDEWQQQGRYPKKLYKAT